jgi:hypothetical protein
MRGGSKRPNFKPITYVYTVAPVGEGFRVRARCVYTVAYEERGTEVSFD